MFVKNPSVSNIRISKKIMDPMKSLKTFWSLLKTLLNNKKIPCIPPLLQDNKYVTDFKKKLSLNFLQRKQTDLSLQLSSIVMILQH